MKKNSQAFANQLIVCLLVAICFGGTIGLGTVWMRHQISVTAKANRDLAAEVVRLGRLIDEKRIDIETEQAPDKLRSLNAALSIGMVPTSEIPVVSVGVNPVDRLARRSARELFTDAAPAAAVSVNPRFVQR